MKKIDPKAYAVVLFWFFSTVHADDNLAKIVVSAGELDSITDDSIVIRICTGRAADGETTCPSRTELFTLSNSTRCIDVDESSVTKLQEQHTFWVYKEMSDIQCSALSDREMVSVYHIENTSEAIAVRDNAVPMMNSMFPVLMPMTGTFTPYESDPVLHRL